MKIILKENETMQDIVNRLVASSELVSAVAPLAYWYENLNENGRIKDIHFSQRMREMLGYRTVEEFPDELNTLMTFAHPDDVHIMLDNAIAAGTGKIDEYNVEYRIRNASGGYTWCNATGQVVKDHKGTTVGMYGAFIDITGKKSIDESTIIRSFAQEYDAAFFGNLSTRAYKVIANNDKVADQIAGIENLGEALRVYVQNFVHPHDVCRFEEYLFRAETVREHIGIGQHVSFEYRSDTDGEYKWYRALFRRLNENDVLLGFKNCDSEVNEKLANDKLLDGYDAIYMVNLDRNEIWPARSSRVSKVGAFQEKTEYDRIVREFAETVAPKYRHDWIRFSDPAYMKQYMANADHREYIYVLPGTALTMRRFTVDVLEREGADASVLLFSFAGIDDLRAKTILLNQKMAEQKVLLDYFVNSYDSAYTVNLDDDTYEIFHMDEQSAKLFGSCGEGREGIEKYISKYIHPDDRAMVRHISDKEYLKETLRTEKSFTFTVREIIGGVEKVKRGRVIRVNDEEHVAVGFMDITEQVEKENEAQRHIAIEQNNRRIMALEDNLESLYDVELESGRYTEYVKGDFYRQNVTDKLAREGDFFVDIQGNIDTVIYPDDRDALKKALSNRDNIRKALTETDRIEHFYRMFVGDKPLWFKLRIVYKDKERNNLIIGCFSAESEMAEKQRNEELVSTFSKQFSAVYYGNLEDGSYQILVKKENVLSIIAGTNTICDAIRTFAEKTVHPSDIGLFRKDFYSIETIKARLAVGESYTFEYRSDNYGEYRWFRAEFRRTTEKDLLVGFRDCNDEVLERLEHERLQKENAEQSIFTSYFLQSYRTAYYVDLNTLEAKIYKNSFDPKTEGSIITDYFVRMHEKTNMAVKAEDREKLNEFFSPDIIRNSLKHTEVLTDIFRDTLAGEEQTVRVEIVRGSDESHVAIGFKNVTEEIRKQKEQQRLLEEALSMAQSANRAKTTFLNNMSHDIRTPMNAIIGYTGLAASHIDNKEQVQDYLSKIGQSSDHLLSLINDVLDMSRIESGKMNLDEKEENLSDIIHTLRDIVQADIHSKQLDFFVDAVDVNDEDIICDKLRLNQVLLNVLSNAIKYTPAGGTVIMRVKEKTVKNTGYATFEFVVKDNGMGMDKEFLNSIFDPFTRVKSSTVSGIQGTGLGMAITKNIIDMMGGRIDIESEPQKGTEVTVTFDFKLQSTPKEAVVLPELEGLRALVVDDDSNTCLSISTMLREIGMREEWCTSGKEAVIRAAEAFRIGRLFRVFIIDWLMPDMNGIETTRRIRKVIGDDVPIIILTAYDWSDIEEEALDAGVTAFVSKPMFPSDLHRVLSKCLGKEENAVQEEKKPMDFIGKKILLVEDNELNREIATAVLEEYGCVVFQAEDGDIAVKLMKKADSGDYDLVLMDIQMPILDGYRATEQIRALGTEISKIPIIAMTANAFEEDRRAALDAGMNDHIAKPIDMNKLKQVLAKFLV